LRRAAARVGPPETDGGEGTHECVKTRRDAPDTMAAAPIAMSLRRPPGWSDLVSPLTGGSDASVCRLNYEAGTMLDHDTAWPRPTVSTAF
jgi:hypothetical protein